VKFHRSIRFRVLAGILMFGVVLVTINTFISFIILGRNMERLIYNLLDTEVEFFLYQYEKDRTAPLPSSQFIKAFRGEDELPQRIREMVKGLGPGVHNLGRNDRHPHHVGVIRLPDTGDTHYLFFRGRAFFMENDFLNPRQGLMISLALVLIPGAIIGLITSWLLFRPVMALINKIRALNPEDIPDRWSVKSRSGEIGMLTASIETAMQRIKAFIQREKQFTRDASHELRTPLTIVKGAVEIMAQQPELEANPLLKNPLNRISRSVCDMENTIETFLWLAREEDAQGESCRVGPVVEKAVSNTRYLIEGKDVDLVVDLKADPELPVREEILYIAVANLVRNAFQFTRKGRVTVVSEAGFISIADTGVGIAPERLEAVTRSHIKGELSQGFGLGLSIVDRLCKRFGWRLEIESHPGSGTGVTIYWG